MKKSIKASLAIASATALSIGGFLITSPSAQAAAGDYYVRDANQNVGAGNDSGVVTVQCDTGDKATGGGVAINWSVSTDYDQVQIQQTYPLYSSGVAYGWVGSLHNGEAATRNMRVYVICDDVA